MVYLVTESEGENESAKGFTVIIALFVE